jgi:hypothetical protein
LPKFGDFGTFQQFKFGDFGIFSKKKFGDFGIFAYFCSKIQIKDVRNKSFQAENI